MQAYEYLLRLAYLSFNKRDIDGAATLMHPDVEWANGMEGGYVYGHQGVRDYWTRQWTLINPHVEPVSFTIDEQCQVRTEVNQLIKDLSGATIAAGTVYHIYQIENGLIRRMSIEQTSNSDSGGLLTKSA